MVRGFSKKHLLMRFRTRLWVGLDSWCRVIMITRRRRLSAQPQAKCMTISSSSIRVKHGKRHLIYTNQILLLKKMMSSMTTDMQKKTKSKTNSPNQKTRTTPSYFPQTRATFTTFNFHHDHLNLRSVSATKTKTDKKTVESNTKIAANKWTQLRKRSLSRR